MDVCVGDVNSGKEVGLCAVPAAVDTTGRVLCKTSMILPSRSSPAQSLLAAGKFPQIVVKTTRRNSKPLAFA